MAELQLAGILTTSHPHSSMGIRILVVEDEAPGCRLRLAASGVAGCRSDLAFFSRPQTRPVF